VAAGSISVNRSLVATVNPSLMPLAVGLAASQAVTYQLSSADLDQLLDDACLVLSTVPDYHRPAVRGLPADAHLPYQLGERSMFCDASAGQGDAKPCVRCQIPCCSQSLHQAGRDAQAHRRPHSEGPHKG
jgi:hypothetical protein